MIAVGILTHNLFAHDRVEEFRRTLRSLLPQLGEDSLYVVDNGSTDGTAAYVEKLGGLAISDPITTFGHGANVTIGICAKAADVVVFSNDDIEWAPNALKSIRQMWAEAPADVGIIGGLLEEDFPWNTVRARIEIAGHVGLVRDSAPGAAWSFRSETWAKMRPLPEVPGGGDVEGCRRLLAKGYRLCQFDLAAHLGQDKSTWGNGSKRFAKPLDRSRWDLPLPQADASEHMEKTPEVIA